LRVSDGRESRLVVIIFGVFSLIAFLLVFFGGLFDFSIESYSVQRFFMAVMFFGIGCTVILNRSYRLFLFRDLWVGFLVFFLFNCMWFPYFGRGYSWVEPGMYSMFFLGFILVGASIGVGQSVRDCVIIFSNLVGVVVFLYGASTLTIYIFALSDKALDFSLYIPWGFVNIRYWSHMATWLLPILPIAVLVGPIKDERLWRFFVGLGAALWWWIVFLSTSRGTIVSVAFGVLFVTLLIGRPAFPWLRVFLRYFAYGVIAWLLLSVLIPSMLVDEVTLRQVKSDTSGRMPLFFEAWKMSLVNFPFGMGPQSWLTHNIITESYRDSRKFAHPHNMYLMWAAEYGWLEGRVQAVVISAYTASVAAALIHASVSAVFLAPGSMLVGFLVLCVFWALIMPTTRYSSCMLEGRRLCLVAVCIAGVWVIIWGLWFGEVWDYHSAMVEDLEYYQENGSGGMMPRFWFHGNFPRTGQ